MTGPGHDDHAWLLRAIELSRRCPPSTTAYSVGAVIVDARGREITTGYSRETGPAVHAEEVALARLAGDGDTDPASGTDPAAGAPRVAGVTLYSTLEPCSQRSSRPRTCTELIIAAGIARVVVAWREPDLFVPDCLGLELLTAAGVAVTELKELADAARAANAHLPL